MQYYYRCNNICLECVWAPSSNDTWLPLSISCTEEWNGVPRSASSAWGFVWGSMLTSSLWNHCSGAGGGGNSEIFIGSEKPTGSRDIGFSRFRSCMVVFIRGSPGSHKGRAGIGSSKPGTPQPPGAGSSLLTKSRASRFSVARSTASVSNSGLSKSGNAGASSTGDVCSDSGSSLGVWLFGGEPPMIKSNERISWHLMCDQHHHNEI